MDFSFIQLLYITIAITRFMLDARQNVLARPLALLGNCLSIYIYYSETLYAKSLLKATFLILNAYGWYQWLYGGENKTPLRISTTSPRHRVIIATWVILAAWVLGTLLTLYSDASLPYWDSLPAVMALTGYGMLMRKKLEAWLLFVPTDILYTTLLYYRGLYLLSALHCFYTILAINAYYKWRQSYKEEKSLGVSLAASQT